MGDLYNYFLLHALNALNLGVVDANHPQLLKHYQFATIILNLHILQFIFVILKGQWLTSKLFDSFR